MRVPQGVRSHGDWHGRWGSVRARRRRHRPGRRPPLELLLLEGSRHRHRRRHHREVQPLAPVPLPRLGHRPGQVHRGGARGAEDQPGAPRARPAEPRLSRHGGRLRRRLLGQPVPGRQRARQRHRPPLRRRPLRLLPQAPARVGDAGAQVQHAGRDPGPDGELRRLEGPAGAAGADVHRALVPSHDRPLPDVGEVGVRGVPGERRERERRGRSPPPPDDDGKKKRKG